MCAQIASIVATCAFVRGGGLLICACCCTGLLFAAGAVGTTATMFPVFRAGGLLFDAAWTGGTMLFAAAWAGGITFPAVVFHHALVGAGGHPTVLLQVALALVRVTVMPNIFQMTCVAFVRLLI